MYVLYAFILLFCMDPVYFENIYLQNKSNVQSTVLLLMYFQVFEFTIRETNELKLNVLLLKRIFLCMQQKAFMFYHKMYSFKIKCPTVDRWEIPLKCEL